MPQRGDVLRHLLLYILRMRRRVHGFINVLSESFLYLPLWLIFRRTRISSTYAPRTPQKLGTTDKNLLTKSGTERFRENILWSGGYYEVVSFIGPAYWKAGQ